MGHRCRGLRRRWVVTVVLSATLIACGGSNYRAQAPSPVAAPSPAAAPAQPASAPEPTPEIVETVTPAGETPSLASPTTAADIPSFEDRLAEMTAEEREVELNVRKLELEALATPPAAAELQDSEAPADEPEENALLDEITETVIPEDYSLPENRLKRLARTDSDMPLVLNEQVVRMVNYFTGTRGRRTIKAALGRSGAYREMIERILEEEDVPAEIFYLAQAESGFRPKARSYARATGMWQFMAFRGRQYQLRQDKYLEERYDAEKATRAAAKHLKDLYIEFEDWYLAMAAYNCGPGRVTRAIARGKTRDYWELSRKRLLPRQTRSYVPIILAMTYVSKNLDMYDLGEIDYAPPLRYDTVETDVETTLELIADVTDSTVETIKQLNPALHRSATPPYSYALRLPPGTSEAFERELAAVPAEKRASWRRHRLTEGETLAAVAKQFGVKEAELMALNNLDAASQELAAGMRLTVPTTTKIRSYRVYGGAGGLMQDGTGRYRIARGDTLGGIGRRFGVSVGQLREWNGLPSSRIRAGRYLIVRPEGAGAPVEYDSSSAPTGTYTVRRGDSLSRIAKRYGVSLSRLRGWNGIVGDRLQVGDKLRVPAPKQSASAPKPARQASTRSAAIASSSRPSAAPGPGQYRIRSGDSLSAIADRFGVSVSDLKSWNRLRSSRIRAGKYLIVRPEAVSAPRRAPQVASQRATSQATSKKVTAATGERYRIRSGDTLAAIADRYKVSVADLKDWNNLRSTRIRAGNYLLVGPGSARSESAPRKASSQPAPRQRAASSAPARYKVRPGDSLGVISERVGVSVSDLKAWNGLRSSRIRAGNYLSTRPPSLEGGRYRIQRGDTLELIAKRFKVTIADLKRWNGLRSSRITAGDYLTVRALEASASTSSGS